MSIDVYRPLVVMLDAIEFAAKQALDKPKTEPVTFRRSDDMGSLWVMGASIGHVAPHLRFEISRSAVRRVTDLGAKCECGARFSLIPLDEHALVTARAPSRMLAEWAIDGLLAHRCEAYP